MEISRECTTAAPLASHAHHSPTTSIPCTRWHPTFTYAERELFYNRIPFNNCAERAVEIPLAFDFLTRQACRSTGIGRMLELGHVLHSYENGLSETLGLRVRRIVDKFEIGYGVENVDFMDIAIERYDTIVAISTVEHIGQNCAPSGEFGERVQSSSREEPLRAIARIYALLAPGGRALVTMPVGRLTDGGWYIQFSPAYLELLHTWYGLPQQDVELRFLRQVVREPRWRDLGRNPRQHWSEATADEIADVRYNDLWSGARAVAVLELTKGDLPYTLPRNISAVPLFYATSSWRKSLSFALGSLLSCCVKRSAW